MSWPSSSMRTFETWWLVAAKICSRPTAIRVAISTGPPVMVGTSGPVVHDGVVGEQRTDCLGVVRVEVLAVRVDQVRDRLPVGQHLHRGGEVRRRLVVHAHGR